MNIHSHYLDSFRELPEPLDYHSVSPLALIHWINAAISRLPFEVGREFYKERSSFMVPSKITEEFYQTTVSFIKTKYQSEIERRRQKWFKHPGLHFFVSVPRQRELLAKVLLDYDLQDKVILRGEPVWNLNYNSPEHELLLTVVEVK